MKIFRKGIACEYETCYVKGRQPEDIYRDLFDGVWPTRVRLSDTLYLLCDEAGSLKHLPVNFMLKGGNLPLQPIVGEVIMVHMDASKKDPNELVMADVTKEDRETLDKLLDEEQQRDWLISYFFN